MQKPEKTLEEKLHAAVVDFYDRVFADAMIGFLFKGKDRARLIEKELELWRVTLGHPVRYTGRTMSSAHMQLRIMRGMFDRRLQILRETLQAHDLPEDVRETLVRHSESLRKMIINVGKECAEGPTPGSEEK